MALTLHFHPLSSYCHKVLIALYELDAPFEPKHVDLSTAEGRAAFRALSPWGKMPALHDAARDRTVVETSIIVEYLDRHYPGARPLLPADADAQLEVRLWDRIFDLYVHTPMQAAVAAVLQGEPDRMAPHQAALADAYPKLEAHLSGRTWAAGDAFSLADCAATPALFYARALTPFAPEQTALAAYFERLVDRPSVARTLAEAKPWLRMFPLNDRLEARFLAEAD